MVNIVFVIAFTIQLFNAICLCVLPICSNFDLVIIYDFLWTPIQLYFIKLFNYVVAMKL